MQFPKTILLSFVATCLFLLTIPTSGVVAGRIPVVLPEETIDSSHGFDTHPHDENDNSLTRRSFREDHLGIPRTDHSKLNEANAEGVRFVGDRIRRSFGQVEIRIPPRPRCEPGEHGPNCKPPSIQKRSPLQISSDEGKIPHGLPHSNVEGKDPNTDVRDPNTDVKDPNTDGGDPTPTGDLPIIPENSLAKDPTIHLPSDIEPHMISITSTLSSVQDQSGYLGICQLPHTSGDGLLGDKNDKSPVAKFLSNAEKSAKCNWLTDSEAHCVEQGGKQDMQEEDKTWWEQAFCKRCVDAGGLSRPEFSCPKGYSTEEILKRLEGAKKPKIDWNAPHLIKSDVRQGAVGENDAGKKDDVPSVGGTTPDENSPGAGEADPSESKTKGSNGGLVRRNGGHD